MTSSDEEDEIEEDAINYDDGNETALEEQESEEDESSDEEVVRDEQEFLKMEKCWKFLSPPTGEKELIGKWLACLFDHKN